MSQSLIDRYKKWAKKKSPLRLYQIFLVLFIIILSIFFPLSNPPSSTSFSADNWAQMAISIGASVLTLLAIIVAIGLSNENIKRLDFNEILTSLINKIEEKKRNNPDRTIDELYDASEEKIQAVADSVPILKYTESLLALLSFVFFLLSAIFAVMNFRFVFALGTFAYATVFLIGYLTYVIEEFANMDKYSRAIKKKGSLELLDIRINGTHRQFEVQNKVVNLTLRRLLERLELTVRIKGNIRNGFLHATVRYRNNWVSYIPDCNTYLGSFGFVDDYHFTLLEKQYDTGILQVDGSIELDFEIPLRISKNTEDNPLIASGFVENLGIKQIYKHCSVPADILIDSIELRIYEDPLYRPNSKRREIDCITLRIAEQMPPEQP